MSDLRYYRMPSQTWPSGNKAVYGQLGEVMGPSAIHPNQLAMKFPGNKGNIYCFLTQLSRNPPVRVGWWVWWVKSGVEGGV